MPQVRPPGRLTEWAKPNQNVPSQKSIEALPNQNVPSQKSIEALHFFLLSSSQKTLHRCQK
jgi:hypothetical protein